MTRYHVLLLTGLSGLVVAYPFLGLSAGLSSGYYQVVQAAALAVGWVALVRHRPVRLRGWVALLGGFTAWSVGDLVWSVENDWLHLDLFPAPSDAVYLLGYALLAAGALSLARSRLHGRDVMAVLDACILATGITVPVVVFVVLPAFADTSMSLGAQLTTAAYPVADVVVLGMLTRMITAPGGRSWSFAAVASALLVTLAADGWWIAITVNGEQDSASWSDAVYLSTYVMRAASVCHRSMHRLVDRPVDTSPRAPSRRRLVLLAIGLITPSATLLVAGLTGRTIPFATLSIGGMVMGAMVLARMAGLLDRLRQQAAQLAEMARRDELTGAPNRRSWNFELARACGQAEESGEPLSVAILDLDHFKRYNDAHGHVGGDRLLRDAVAAWTAALPTDARLARYGGEEFAVLLPGRGLDEAAAHLRALAAVTPGGQTFSAGVARWLPGTEPETAVSAADLALYSAKRSGRNRVETARSREMQELPMILRDFTLALQPIVDAGTGRVMAHEALSRFPHDGDVVGVYQQAHRDGYGDLLEATAVRRAMRLPERPLGTELFVNVSLLALASERFWHELPSDLNGLVFELLESRDTLDWETLGPQLEELRRRGARLAVDDLGAGSGDLARFLMVRPHVVKIDRALVDGCTHDDTRTQLLRIVVEMAHASGAVVCAEGVEQGEDLDTLRRLQVDLVQGYLIGRPAPTWSAGDGLPQLAGSGLGS